MPPETDPPDSDADSDGGSAPGDAAPAPLNTDAGTVAGTVAILGRPNVGKSTLLNQIVGEKLAIVSPKPQTTRDRIVGVWNGVAGQIVFVDTPGVHPGKKGLNRFMVGQALGTIRDADAVLLVVDIFEERPGDAERKILSELRTDGKRAVLAINKVDKAKDKSTLLPLLTAWQEVFPFAALVPICALKGTNVPALVSELCKLMPTGAPLYGPDMLTDRTERFLAAELVREQLFLKLRQELPYAVAIKIESWEERDRGDVVISATILVERDSQKAIVVGKAGAMIREVGTDARREISDRLGRPAHLKLEVKVAPEWTTSPELLAELGYRP